MNRTIKPLKRIDDTSVIIGVETNYEKWGNQVFPIEKGSRVDVTKRRQIKILDEEINGQHREGYVVVIPGEGDKAFTSETRDVLTALQQLFVENDCTDDPIETSINTLLKMLYLPSNGSNAKFVVDQLHSLIRTTVSWQESFRVGDNERTSVKDHHLLDVLSYVKNDELGMADKRRTDSDRVTFRLAESIRTNVRDRVVIPVNLSARRAIKSSLGRTVYARVDNIVNQPGRSVAPLELTATTIIEWFLLKPESYKFLSKRKRLCENIAKYIDQSESSKKGYKILTQALPTSDKSDYKVKFTLKKSDSKRKSLKRINDDETAQGMAYEIGAEVGQAEANEKLYLQYAQVYPATVIFRAISEFKEVRQSGLKIKSSGALFSTILHRICHSTGQEWIIECGNDCKYRPENLLL